MSLTADELNTLCSPSYLDGLSDAPVTELRARRESCQQAELVLSYVRRVLQGEIDLVLAQLELRSTGAHNDIGRLVEELPSILASSTPTGGEPAHLPLPGMDEITESGDELALEELLGVVVASESSGSQPGGLLPGANLVTFSDDELQASLSRLKEAESGVSRKRRTLHEHIDEIQAAIVDRYKSGAADPDSLLA